MIRKDRSSVGGDWNEENFGLSRMSIPNDVNKSRNK